MFIPVPKEVIVLPDYDDIVRHACSILSGQGVGNYLHYHRPRKVELFDPPRLLGVTIDYEGCGVRLYELK